MKKNDSALLHMIELCNGKKELEQLLDATFTEAEKEMIEERFHILFHLNNGETQRVVKDKLNISIATVTRGAKVLKYGTGIIQKLLIKTHYFDNHKFKK
jgi:Trp operon repressor